MVVTLGDLFDLDLLQRMIDGGYVRRQTHPELPLAILNYSEHAQFERCWNPVTTQCRGLIYNLETQEVMARPFPKFFNHTEPGAPVIPLDAMVEVTDKLDGSLAILFDDGDGGAIATRGSFTSDQAVWATALWKLQYRDSFKPQPGMTYLFEMIYPANRIVVDYKGASDLYLLGAVEIKTGFSYGPLDSEECASWPGPRTTVLKHCTFAEALSIKPRPAAEGIVVRRELSEDRVKIKQDDYIQLHKLVTGLNERVVWEHLGSGGTVVELCEPLPDEFRTWVTEVSNRLTDELADILTDAQREHAELLAELPEGWIRKDYALRASTSPNRAILFQLLDGKDPKPGVWRTLRPSGAVTMTGYSEDVA